MTCQRHNYLSAGTACTVQRAAAHVCSRAVTHDVTEEEVINGLGKVIGIGAVAPLLRIRGRGDFSRVTLLLRDRNFLPSYWKLHTAEK